MGIYYGAKQLNAHAADLVGVRVLVIGCVDAKLLPFLMTNDKGDFRDFANREILDRLQEQKGVTRPSCSEDKRFERAVNVGWRFHGTYE